MKSGKTKAVGIILLFAVTIAVLVGVVMRIATHESEQSVDELLRKVKVSTSTPRKSPVTLDDESLYDELPEISKYPLIIEGDGDVNIEIFSSGEKAGTYANKPYDSWLVDVVRDFNQRGVTTSSGKEVGVSLRQLSSGQGGDYIISGKYVPDLYTPSNELFGNYVIAKGGKVELYEGRLVGNVAGLLVKKGSSYKSLEDVAAAVADGSLNFGYTVPNTSATGMNLLMTLLNMYDPSDLSSDKAVAGFTAFQQNIPYVAQTTMQMSDSAANGSLDGMCMEYQTYINNPALKNEYEFIPFGVRHDNPLYISVASKNDKDKKEAVDLFYEFCESGEMQELATEKGFNREDGYTSELSFTGSSIDKALALYKKNKDTGNDVIAVFVADCSGSMDGEPIMQLKSSLINGMKYINDNNKVGLVSYSSDVRIDLPIRLFDLTQKSYFQGAVENFRANGGTSTYEALVVALDMIKKAKAEEPDAKTMIFLLSDGYANGDYTISTVEHALREEQVPIYTIGYTADADTASLSEISAVNEAVSISADSEDIVYKIKSLFNSSL